MRIGILKSHSQRRTRRMALVNAAHDLGEIGLDARSRTLRTALPPEDILLEISLGQFQSWWDSPKMLILNFLPIVFILFNNISLFNGLQIFPLNTLSRKGCR